MKLKIEPELTLRSEEQLPQSRFLICLCQTLLVRVHIFPSPSVRCRCWHTKRWLSSLSLEGKIEQCAIHHFFFHIRNWMLKWSSRCTLVSTSLYGIIKLAGQWLWTAWKTFYWHDILHFFSLIWEMPIWEIQLPAVLTPKPHARLLSLLCLCANYIFLVCFSCWDSLDRINCTESVFANLNVVAVKCYYGSLNGSLGLRFCNRTVLT